MLTNLVASDNRMLYNKLLEKLATKCVDFKKQIQKCTDDLSELVAKNLLLEENELLLEVENRSYSAVLTGW